MDNFSLAAQRAKADAWAAYQGLSPVQHYEDGGVSGKKNNRPALSLLMDDLQVGDTVLVYSLSRLGRGGVLQLLGVIRDIEERGARLVSMTESIDTKTPTGRLLLTILAALAEMEVETTKERILLGKNQAADEGIWPHAAKTLPYGYTRGEDGRVIIHEGELPLLLEIFDMARQGRSLNSMATEINRRGILGRQGGRWCGETINRFIKQEAYWRGFITHNIAGLPATPVPLPPVLTKSEWDALQRTQSSQQHKRNPDIYPLTGHLRCGCGSIMTGNKLTNRKGQVARYYTCRAMFRKSPRCPVHGKYTAFFSVASIHEEAKNALLSALQRPEVLRALLVTDEAIADPHSEQRAILEAKRTALIDLHLEGLIDRSEFVRRRDGLSLQIQKLAPETPPQEPEANQNILNELTEAVRKAKGEHFNELCQLLKAQFVVHEGGTVTLESLTIPTL